MKEYPPPLSTVTECDLCDVTLCAKFTRVPLAGSRASIHQLSFYQVHRVGYAPWSVSYNDIPGMREDECPCLKITQVIAIRSGA